MAYSFSRIFIATLIVEAAAITGDKTDLLAAQRYVQRDLISRSAVFPTHVGITAGDHALAMGLLSKL